MLQSIMINRIILSLVLSITFIKSTDEAEKKYINGILHDKYILLGNQTEALQGLNLWNIGEDFLKIDKNGVKLILEEPFNDHLENFTCAKKNELLKILNLKISESDKEYTDYIDHISKEYKTNKNKTDIWRRIFPELLKSDFIEVEKIKKQNDKDFFNKHIAADENPKSNTDKDLKKISFEKAKEYLETDFDKDWIEQFELEKNTIIKEKPADFVITRIFPHHKEQVHQENSDENQQEHDEKVPSPIIISENIPISVEPVLHQNDNTFDVMGQESKPKEANSSTSQSNPKGPNEKQPSVTGGVEFVQNDLLDGEKGKGSQSRASAPSEAKKSGKKTTEPQVDTTTSGSNTQENISTPSKNETEKNDQDIQSLNGGDGDKSKSEGWQLWHTIVVCVAIFGLLVGIILFFMKGDN